MSWVRMRRRSPRDVGEHESVHVDEIVFGVGDLVSRIDGIDGALRHACVARCALVGVDIEHRVAVHESQLVVRRMRVGDLAVLRLSAHQRAVVELVDALDRTYVDARLVFGVDACTGDHIGICHRTLLRDSEPPATRQGAKGSAAHTRAGITANLSAPEDLDRSRPGPSVRCAPEHTWITPIADERVIDLHSDPAVVVTARETIRLAFVSALPRLPARQRAALVLCDVLRWPAIEVAELLDTSTPSINSALQRARAAMTESAPTPMPVEALTDDQQRLLSRYLDAFERYDMDALSRLLHDDVIQSIPPYAMWLQGCDDVLAWWAGPGAGCEGSKLIAGWANGCRARSGRRRRVRSACVAGSA